MKNSKFVFDKLSEVFEKGLITSKDLGNEIFNILRSKRDEIVFKMKLTSKDEFEVLAKRVENLENKIAKLKQTKTKTVAKKKIKRVKKS
jgi:BMFP domain-containing protein YqiC